VLKGVHRQPADALPKTTVRVALEAPRIVVDITTSGRQRDIFDNTATEHLRRATATGKLEMASDAQATRIRWTWSDSGE
jgi:hypothetical protein